MAADCKVVLPQLGVSESCQPKALTSGFRVVSPARKIQLVPKAEFELNRLVMLLKLEIERYDINFLLWLLD